MSQQDNLGALYLFQKKYVVQHSSYTLNTSWLTIQIIHVMLLSIFRMTNTMKLLYHKRQNIFLLCPMWYSARVCIWEIPIITYQLISQGCIQTNADQPYNHVLTKILYLTFDLEYVSVCKLKVFLYYRLNIEICMNTR